MCVLVFRAGPCMRPIGDVASGWWGANPLFFTSPSPPPWIWKRKRVWGEEEVWRRAEWWARASLNTESDPSGLVLSTLTGSSPPGSQAGIFLCPGLNLHAKQELQSLS